MLRAWSAILLLSAAGAAGALADPAGELLDQVSALDKDTFEGYQGYLFQSWLQFDENDPTYVVYIGDRKYSAMLDDGRGTSQRARQCKKENVFDENPSTGCSVSFNGQYVVEDNGGTVEVSVIIWNVEFR